MTALRFGIASVATFMVVAMILLGACTPAPASVAVQPAAAPQVGAASEGVNIYQGTLLEKEKTTEVSTEELRQALVQKSALVFDARSAKEYAISHIPGALNGTAADIGRQVPDKTAPIILYCNGPFCPLSKNLADQLLQAGYTNVRRYQLGMPTWRALVGLSQIERDGVRYVVEGDKTAVLFDTRSPDEFKAGSLPGARNLPLADLDKAKTDGRLPGQDHNTRIVVFGQNGEQARSVAEALTKLAFDNVTFYAGDWDTLK